ncbi:MAG: DUF3822 family protein [Dysgonomonas sp.]|nr:DUF3822 family protein [Dysgonomonas sp.]
MFLPESIDLEQSDKYILSIRIEPTSFMFSIYEPGNESNYCLRDTTFSVTDGLFSNIKRIIFELSFLTLEFKRTNVIIVNKDYDMIPASYFDERQKADIYNFVHFDKASHIISNLQEKQDIVSIFNMDKEIFEFLSRNLWSPVFFHHSTLLASFFERSGRLTGNSSKIYLNFQDKFLDVFCFSGQKLTHSLTYENETPASQLYYILKLWEMCNLDQLNDTLFIAGKPEEMLIHKLEDYIKYIDRINTPSEIYLWNEDAQKAPLDLLTLSL